MTEDDNDKNRYSTVPEIYSNKYILVQFYEESEL